MTSKIALRRHDSPAVRRGPFLDVLTCRVSRPANPNISEECITEDDLLESYYYNPMTVCKLSRLDLSSKLRNFVRLS